MSSSRRTSPNSSNRMLRPTRSHPTASGPLGLDHFAFADSLTLVLNTDGVRPLSLDQKLPGKPRPCTEVLAEYQAQRANVRPEMWVLRDLFMPPPEEIFRWRVQLGCGCIHERLSHRDQTRPSEWQEHDAVTQCCRPTGQVSCRHDDDLWSEYQEISSWGDVPKVREVGPDPIEPRDGI